MGPLYKTTIVIWSKNPIPDDIGLEEIGREATGGQYYCSSLDVVQVGEPEADKDWDGTEFFGARGDP